MRLINRIGLVFNRLTIIERVVIDKLPYYKCKCQCGKVLNIRTHRVVNGSRKSCGCIRKESFEARGLDPVLTPGLAAARKVINYYKRNARQRSISFLLTEAECLNIFKQDCYYCGKPPRTVLIGKGYNGSFCYNGIDRKNNNIHYTLTNCVPACKNCNFMKNNLTIKEFLDHITQIYKHLNP